MSSKFSKIIKIIVALSKYRVIILFWVGKGACMTNYQQVQKRKSIYIPLCCAGKMTIQQAAQKIGVTPHCVSMLKKKYRESGEAAFSRSDRGHVAYNLKYDKDFQVKLLMIYHESWEGCPYKTFWRALQDFYNININYESLRQILRKNGIKPLRKIKSKEKPMHESRRERPCMGELIQMDASKHDWFMNGTYANLHGAIDDATHTITGLYFCENECRLGYNEVLRQTFVNYGKPEAVYIDRHSSFVTTPKGKDITIEERLYAEKSSETHFNDLCRQLKIEVILALSAQGKGRIERLWQTLQGILPFYFRYLKIDSCSAANQFIQKWLIQFNKENYRAPVSEFSKFRKFYKKSELDYMLAIKENKRTDKWGYFVFHSHDFKLLAPRPAHQKFTLLLSEQFGIKALLDGKYYDVELCDTFNDSLANKMPQVEKDLIDRYLMNDLHNDSYA